jgi:hypothetical protein
MALFGFTGACVEKRLILAVWLQSDLSLNCDGVKLFAVCVLKFCVGSSMEKNVSLRY